MIIRLHRGQLRWFREKAKRAYPQEILALLVGQRPAPQIVTVSYFEYPPLEQATDRVKVDMTGRQYEDLCELIKTRDPNLYVVGTIHSHCDAPPTMSRTDKRTHIACGDKVSGILTILGSGKTWVEFWQAKDCLALKREFYP